MSKGDARRPTLVTPEEEQLRWDYATTEMTLEEFNKRYEELKKQGLIKRNGRVQE